MSIAILMQTPVDFILVVYSNIASLSVHYKGETFWIFSFSCIERINIVWTLRCIARHSAFMQKNKGNRTGSVGQHVCQKYYILVPII